MPAFVQVGAATVTERGASRTGKPLRGSSMWDSRAPSDSNESIKVAAGSQGPGREIDEDAQHAMRLPLHRCFRCRRARADRYREFG